MKSKQFFSLTLALLMALVLLPPAPARAEDTYAVTVTADPTEGGSVTGAGSYPSGQTVTLTAAPAEGYRFKAWSSADVTVAEDGTFTMPAKAVAVTATFEQQRTVIWLNGDDTELDRKTYWTEEGEPVTDKTSTKDADGTFVYVFAGWDNGAVAGDVKTYTPLFTNLPIYTVVKGAKSSYRIKSGKTYMLTVQRTVDQDTIHEDVADVQIGRIHLAPDTDYTVTKGSAVISVTPAAMNKLSEGNHRVVVTFRDGTAVKAVVSIQAAYDDHTGTGDNSHMFLWLGVAVMGMLGLVVLHGEKRKYRER